MALKPGKRPDNLAKKKQRHNHNHGDSSSSNYPKQWDTRLTTQLRRCILSHDIKHIITWHTPAYSLFVYLSIICTLIGFAQFHSTFQYCCALATAAICIFGSARYLQLESGPNAVVVPTELKVRNKSVVEFNVKTLYSRWVSPTIEFLTENLISGSRLKDLRVVGGGVLVLLVIGELAKYISASMIFVMLVSVVFAVGGVRRIAKM